MKTTPHRIGFVCVIITGIGLLLGVGGCRTTAPALSVVEARATERSPDGLTMLFTVEARSDNDDALPLRNVDYTVELGGKTVFRGTRSAEATIRRHGSQRFSLPAVINLSRDPSFTQAGGQTPYRISGSVQYVTPGQLAEVLFDAGVRVPNVSFSGQGQIDLGAAAALVPTDAGTSPLSVEITRTPAEPPEK